MKLKDLILTATPVLAAIISTTSTFMWSSGAFAQANTSLSNLTSPTAINQSLLVNADNTYNLGSSTDALANIYAYTMNGGAENFTIQAQNVASGNGYLTYITGSTTSDSSPTATGGSLFIAAGSATGYGGGSITLSGGANSGGGGGITITAGGGSAVQTAIDLVGHLQSETIGSISVSSCGTGASISTATDNAGRISVGTGTSTCTLNFGATWENTPACVVSDEKARVALLVVPSTTTLVISAAGNFAAGTVLDYICQGFH